MKRIFCLLAVLLLVLSLPAAWAENVSGPVRIEQQDSVIAVGKTLSLKLKYDKSVKRYGAKLKWLSTNEEVASVSDRGTVRGIAPGRTEIRCEITLKSGEQLQTMTTVEVVQPVEQLSITPEDLITLGTGQSQRLAYTFEPQNADNPEAVWSTSDDSIVAVGTDGTIQGLQPGRAKIFLNAGDGFGAAASVDVLVSPVYAEETEIDMKEIGTVRVPVHFQGRPEEEPTESGTGGSEPAAGPGQNGQTTEERTESELSPEEQWFEENYEVIQEGNGITFEKEIEQDMVYFTLRPNAAAEENHLIIQDRKNPQYRADIQIHVDESAVCDAQKLPVVKAELLYGSATLTYRFELTNNGSEEVGEIGFLVDYRDQFGDTYYLFSNNDGTIQNYSYTTKFNLKPGETKPLIGGTDAFRTGDVITEVRLAVYYYRYVDSGRKVYIPDSQLYWYSTKTGEMTRPEKSWNYEQPDEDTTDLAERINFKLRANTCDLYSYVVKRFSRSRRPGKFVASVGDNGWARTWGLEPMDVIYGADDMLWEDDPFFLNRAFARVYSGEKVTLRVVRNGEEIEIPISTETNP